jgi:hypothetical protein
MLYMRTSFWEEKKNENRKKNAITNGANIPRRMAKQYFSI